MGKAWESARAQTIETCWPEINSERPLVDTTTEGAFKKALSNIEKNTGILETKSWRLDKYWDLFKEALKTRGKNACADIAKSLDNTSYFKKIEMPTNLTPEEIEQKNNQAAVDAARNKAIADAKTAADAAKARENINRIGGVLSAITWWNFNTTGGVGR